MNPINLKLILTGDAPGGKSVYKAKLLTGKFLDSIAATLGVDLSGKNLKLDGIDLKIQIWEISGRDRYSPLFPIYYKEARGAIIMFDLTNPMS